MLIYSVTEKVFAVFSWSLIYSVAEWVFDVFCVFLYVNCLQILFADEHLPWIGPRLMVVALKFQPSPLLQQLVHGSAQLPTTTESNVCHVCCFVYSIWSAAGQHFRGRIIGFRLCLQFSTLVCMLFWKSELHFWRQKTSVQAFKTVYSNYFFLLKDKSILQKHKIIQFFYTRITFSLQMENVFVCVDIIFKPQPPLKVIYW